MRIFILSIVLVSFYGCKVTMEPGGELISTPYTVVKQDGKSVLLIYQDSVGNNYEDPNGIHMVKYSTYRNFKKRTVITEYFNLKGNYLENGSILGYAKAKEVWKKNKIIEQSFMDSLNHLVQPSYMGYARMTQKYFKDESWLVNYYDIKNNPICFNGVTEQLQIWDTIWLINVSDTSYMLRIKTLESKKCKK